MVKKSIIIDFDHTIGYFNQFIFILNIVEKTYNITLNEEQVHCILDHYPLVFRPKLYDILNLILFYETKNQLTFFILYTCNNQPHFVKTIANYLIKKLNVSILFHEIVFENTKTKKVQTILKYINYPHVLCFIDNILFDYRDNRIETKYIKSENYIHHYDIKEITCLFPYKSFSKITETLLKQYFNHKKCKKKRILPYKMYELNSSFILQSIRDFVSSSP